MNSHPLSNLLRPPKRLRAYKLLRLKKGGLYPLFIDKHTETPVGVWLQAECHPTEGYKVRQGWHTLRLPYAPHLRTRAGTIAPDRLWCEVELEDYTACYSSQSQGGWWFIGQRMRIVRVLTNQDIAHILHKHGLPEHIEAEQGLAVEDYRIAA